uniref:uncharacterized protein isoform X1 n=3 Tax=Myxine glutinosa TaxID=7769 RepID=UPI00358EAAAF
MAAGREKTGVTSLLCLALARVQPAQQTNSVMCQLIHQRKSSTQFWEDLRQGICSSRHLVTSELLPESLQASISRLAAQRSTLFKQRKRKGGQHKLEVFMSTEFVLPQRLTVKRKVSNTASSVRPPASKCAKFEETVEHLNYQGLLSDFNIVRSRLDQKEREVVDLSKKNQTLMTSNDNLQRQNKELKQKVSKWCPKRMNNQLSRKAKSSSMWRRKYEEVRKELARLKELGAGDTLEQLKQEKEAARKEKAKMKNNERKRKLRRHNLLKKVKEAKQQVADSAHLRETVKTLHEEMHKARDSELYLQTEVAAIEEKTAEECSAPVLIKTRDGKTFTKQMRSAVYKCIACQVPVERVSSVLEHTVRTLTPHQLDDLPSVSTVCRSVREMGILSDLQVGSTLVSCKNSTLAWDATSLDGKHLNELHVATSQGSMVLGISQMPDGRAVTYYDNITEVLGDTLDSYSQYTGVDPKILEASVKTNVTNTLGDRVVTNHAVVKLLSEGYFGKSLNELNCNVHPLDSVASSGRETLRKRGVPSAVFGNEGAATNVIKAISKMRYKNGRGDPQGFRHLLKSQKIPAKILPRYVGNRLHILFHLAGVVYMLKDVFLAYLENACPVSWRTVLMTDLENQEIMQQLQILGIYGKLFTGPWMELFYGNKAGRSNLEMRGHMHRSVDALAELQDNPGRLLTTETDIFGNRLAEDDPVLIALRNSTEVSESFKVTASQLAAGFLAVLNRQLQRYLHGDLSDPSEEVLAQTASAPTHNIFAEEVLGMVDSQVRRAPNATTQFVESKVKFAKNKTMLWLEGEAEDELQKLVTYAMKRAQEMSRLKKERDVKITAAIERRTHEMKQRRDKTLRNKTETKVRPLVGKVVSRENFLQLFPESSTEVVDAILPILENPASVVNKYLLHTWTDEDGVDVCYQGLVQKSKRKGTVLTISYWKMEETIDDCVDFDVQFKQFVTDILFKELEFV